MQEPQLPLPLDRLSPWIDMVTRARREGMSSAQIICVHVVPHFCGEEMMMSPGRSSKPAQRLLS
jgi:hypothetical protein